MKSRLVIIGNGFDLHHKMKTRYIDYRDYLIKSGKEAIVGTFELSIDGDKSVECIDFLWSHLEELIAILPYEQAYSYLKGYGGENWSDSYHHDFPYEVEKMSRY